MFSVKHFTRDVEEYKSNIAIALKHNDMSFIPFGIQPVISDKDYKPDFAELFDGYCGLLFGAYAQRALDIQEPQIYNVIDKVANTIKWLQQTDFFTTPASTKFHESFECGLVLHHLRVFSRAMDLLQVPVFSNLNSFEVAVCALSHDWGKIGNYESYMRYAKDVNGNWHQVQEYRKASLPYMPMGHGSGSMYMATTLLPMITKDMAAALLWHMGAWHVTDIDKSNLQAANETMPMVHLLQFADQLSIVKY